MEQSLMDKLTILADSAKYDVACTSSGASHPAKRGTIGSCYAPGCCHAFTADGRCVSLLKVLMSNCCAFDCSYCVNRKSNDVPRATFSPRELAELTIEFYRRNYIEGLFLSSAVLGTPDYTTERMLTVLRLLRNEYHFGGYIHAKTIPGTSPELIQQMGYLADRLSVNVELPSEQSLHLLAPDKGRHSIFRPMKQIAVEGAANREEVALYRKAPRFAPAGQSTQMIIGATPDTDLQILRMTQGLYRKYGLKRVFALFQFAGGQFQQHFLVRITELAHKQHFVLFGQRRHAHTAVMAHNLSCTCFAVFQLHGVAQHLDDAAFKLCFACQCFFKELHKLSFLSLYDKNCLIFSGRLPYYYINIFLISQGAGGILLHKSRECGTFYQNQKFLAAVPRAISHF